MQGQLPQDTSDRGTVIFVLGLLGFLVCQVCAPIAFFMGQSYRRNCLAEGMRPSGLGEAGRIMGLVGTILLAFGLVILALYFGFIFLMFFIAMFVTV